MKLLTLAVMSAAMVCAQTFSVGVIGGAPFTDAVSSLRNGTYSSVYKSSNFVVGPSLRVNLPASLRLEFDVLYRPISYQTSIEGWVMNARTSQWQFPLLAAYRFQTPGLKPFVEAGIALDHLTNPDSTLTQAMPAPALHGYPPGALQHATGWSVVLGAGIDVKIPFVRLSGELRFARETVHEFLEISNPNQAEVLFGVHF